MPSASQPTRSKAILLLLIAAAFWGAAYSTKRLGIEAIARGLGPEAQPRAVLIYLWLRYALAAAVLLALRPRLMGRMKGTTWRYSFSLGVVAYGAMVLQLVGLRHSSSTVVAFLTSLYLILTPALGWWLFRDRITRGELAGMAVAVAGTGLLTRPTTGGLGVGEACALAAALAIALQIHLTARLTRTSDPGAITLGMLLCGVAISTAMLLALHGIHWFATSPLPSPTFPALLCLAFDALGPGILATWIVNRHQRAIGATAAAIVYMAEPVFAAIFAALLLRETSTPIAIAGMGLIMIGNTLSQTASGGRPRWAGSRGKSRSGPPPCQPRFTSPPSPGGPQ